MLRPIRPMSSHGKMQRDFYRTTENSQPRGGSSHGRMKREGILPTEPKKIQNSSKFSQVKNKQVYQNVENKPIELKQLDLASLEKLLEETQSSKDLDKYAVEINSRWFRSNKDNSQLNALRLKVMQRQAELYESSSGNRSRDSSNTPTDSGRTPLTDIISEEAIASMTAGQYDTYSKISQIRDEETRRDFLRALSKVTVSDDVPGLYATLKEYTELINSYQNHNIKVFYSNQELQDRFSQNKIEIERGKLFSISEGSYDFVIPITNPEKIFLLEKDSGHTAVATSENQINTILFPRGKPVLYAGTINILNSEIECWTNSSGHYQPDAIHSSEVKATVALLSQRGNLLGNLNEKFINYNEILKQ